MAGSTFTALCEVAWEHVHSPVQRSDMITPEEQVQSRDLSKALSLLPSDCLFSTECGPCLRCRSPFLSLLAREHCLPGVPTSVSSFSYGLKPSNLTGPVTQAPEPVSMTPRRLRKGTFTSPALPWPYHHVNT